jgi:uncharacterized protein with von Willebrand factor type A (vWA) domain
MPDNLLTPQRVEARLYELSKQIDEQHAALFDAENNYYRIKAEYELELAKARLSFSGTAQKLTVGEKADMALVAVQDLHMRMSAAEALVRATRANAQRLRTQVDIARSLGTSVRSSMEL